MHGIGLLTSSGVVGYSFKNILERTPSSEGLEETELFDMAQKVISEIDPHSEGLTFMDFRGLLMRMPDLLTNFDIFIL